MWQVALGASLGIAEPQLVRIMKATLYSHTQWFKLQMCTDPFADLLDINKLKEADVAGGTTSTTNDDSKLGGAAGSCLSTTEISGNQPSDVPRDGPCFDEDNVLTLMVNFTLISSFYCKSVWMSFITRVSAVCKLSRLTGVGVSPE